LEPPPAAPDYRHALGHRARDAYAAFLLIGSTVVSSEIGDIAPRVKATRPMLPAKDFETSRRFYLELGFEPQMLTERLIEMRLGAFSFILQDYYVAEWANNFVMHVRVTDVRRWWDRIVGLDLSARYGVKAKAPEKESWGLVLGLTDPAGVLWRIAEPLG
jgi:hypothetical protein